MTDSFDYAEDDTNEEKKEAEQLRRRREFQYSAAALRHVAPAERICVSHTAFREGLAALDRIYQLSSVSSIQQGARVIGETGTGKTLLTRLFRESLPQSSLFETGAGALYARLPNQPHVGPLVSALLRQLRYPLLKVHRDPVEARRDILLDYIKQKGTQFIFIDEAHHLCLQQRTRLEEGSGTPVSDVLRELMDEAGVGLVLCGSDQLDGLERVDKHLANRLPGRVLFNNFRAPELQAFVKAMGKWLPTFDFDRVLTAEEVPRWMLATRGNPRSIKRLVVEALLVATDANRSLVDKAILRTAFRNLNGAAGLIANPFAEEQPA